jgi:hypothetical protein
MRLPTSTMKQMFSGMKIAMAIDVEDSVVETNAIHQSGSRITLMELDFDKLLANQDKMLEMNRVKPKTLEEAKQILKDIPGIKAEMNRVVEIRFE